MFDEVKTSKERYLKLSKYKRKERQKVCDMQQQQEQPGGILIQLGGGRLLVAPLLFASQCSSCLPGKKY